MTGDGYTPAQLRRLAVNGFEVLHKSALTRAELLAVLPTVHAYILGGDERLDSDLIAAATSLRVVSFVGTGYGAFIDETAARAQGIAIRNTPNIMAGAVAEHTLGLLLGLARGLFSQNESVKRSGRPITGTSELADMLVGLVGLGAIGSRVARILVSAFGCTVIYNSRHRKPTLEEELGLTFYELDPLMQEVDALLLLLPTTPHTVNLLDEARIGQARPGLLLVNTASARLVNPVALKDALETRRIRAAAFDGYWTEPLPSASEDTLGLLALPDDMFVVTPHTAAKTHTAWGRMVELAVDNVMHESDEEPCDADR
jgi:phosphoglycerate dehydrogenase-like enzyme